MANSTSTGKVYAVDTTGVDIVGFDPAHDKLDLGGVSVHNFIVVDTPSGVGSVSYTHLDVYKRQERVGGAVRLRRQDPAGGQVGRGVLADDRVQVAGRDGPQRRVRGDVDRYQVRAADLLAAVHGVPDGHDRHLSLIHI